MVVGVDCLCCEGEGADGWVYDDVVAIREGWHGCVFLDSTRLCFLMGSCNGMKVVFCM